MQATGAAEPAAQAIGAAVVLPVIRTALAAEARELAEWAIAQGVPAVELTATTPGWRDTLRALRRTSPATVVGVGTLRTAEEARAACEHGAGFLVSPVPAPAVTQVGAERGVLVVGGGFTPAELLAAASVGVAKLFPAHALGPRFLRSFMAVAPPATRVVPTGGVGLEDAEAWLEAGAFAVGVGSELRPGPEAAEWLRDLRARRQAAAA